MYHLFTTKEDAGFATGPENTPNRVAGIGPVAAPVPATSPENFWASAGSNGKID